MKKSISGRSVLIVVLLASLLLVVATVAALASEPAVQVTSVDRQATPIVQPAGPDDINNPDMPPLETGGPSGPVIVAEESDLEVNSTAFQSAADAPLIEVWYGTNQSFGNNGDPQKWVNILGNVSGNLPITLLTYTLNGSAPKQLSLGLDERRLAEPGDFLIEIDYTDLNIGANAVVITATDSGGASTPANVTIQYTDGGNTWLPQTYVYSWQGISSINEKAQVVTGEWVIDGSTVRPTVFEFDRLIALGDMSWKDYTVSAPITVHAIDPTGYEAPSFGPGVGFIVRWQGHFDNGTNSQPQLGWRRLGALGWHHWSKSNGTPISGFQFFGPTGTNFGEDSRQLEFDVPYIYKLNVQSNANSSKPATYRFKVWKASLPEPAAWDFESIGTNGETKSGGVVLLAHHVDATFGTVTVKLDSVAPPPALTTKTAGTGDGTLTIVPGKTVFRFGEDAKLTAAPSGSSVFANWAGDIKSGEASGNVANFEMFESRSVTAVFTDPNVVTPISDDFSACALDDDVWTFTNPLQDATLSMTGTQVQIAVPGGASHDYWTDGALAPRIMQAVEDKDFEFEAKIDSPLSLKTQLQGVLVEQDANNWLRFNVQHNGSTYRMLVHSYVSGQLTKRYSQDLVLTAPLYLQVQRTGDVWIMRYATNGQNWTQVAQFSQALNVGAVGVFAGNAGANAPATTVLVDYFFNTASPIVPEDGGGQTYNLQVTTQGTGTVGVSPQKASYGCGEVVTLTATPGVGWKFSEWLGGTSGTNPQTTITMSKNETVTAVFVPDVSYTLDVAVVGNGAVAKTPDKALYSSGESVQLQANAVLGHQFVGWTGDVTGTTNPVTVTVDSNKSVTATFSKAPDRTLVTSVPGGNGSITVAPQKATYLNGETVLLTPVPAPGYSFAGWGGDLDGETGNPYQLVMDSDKVVTAVFAENVHSLTVFESPEDGGDVTVDPLKLLYYDGETVTLTADAAPGYIFLEWTGDLTGSTSPVQTTITKDTEITAVFGTVGEFTLNVVTDGPGTVGKNPLQPNYSFGDVVTLTATADTGYAFVGWSGDLTGNVNPAAITMTDNAVVTARFTLDALYTLDVTPVGNGQVTKSPVKAAYAQDEPVELTAIPDLGYRFVAWGGDLTGTISPATLVMTKNSVVTATFEETLPAELNVSVSPLGTGTVTVAPMKSEYMTGEIVTLTATALPGYAFSGWQGDITGNTTPYPLLVDGDKTIVATFTNEPEFQSDDFNSCDLDLVWQWFDPTGQADYEMTGTQAQIIIPAGANYNIGEGGNFAARLMQPVPNTDLALEVKFESAVSQQYQYQGFLLEQDAANYIYFQLFHNGSEVKVYAGSVENNVLTSRFSQTVSAAGESYLRVFRAGDSWRLDFSEDGTNWARVGRAIKHVIQVNSAGVFAGSHSRNSGAQPGFLAVFDYVFNWNSPISPEDPTLPALNVNVVGPGTVSRTPDKATYVCGEQVTLTATPNFGATFSGWSGDLSGANPAAMLTIDGIKNVTATFASDVGLTYKSYVPVTQ